MDQPIDYQSFFVRLRQAGAGGAWRSEVIHIQSGISRTFYSLDALCSYLRTKTDVAKQNEEES